jgi:hypothetical protein
MLTADVQSAPSGAQVQIFVTVKTVAGLMWGALSGDRTTGRLQLLLVLASAVILGSESRGATFYSLKFETPPTWWVRVRSPYLYPS